jgi:hypothetical protein
VFLNEIVEGAHIEFIAPLHPRLGEKFFDLEFPRCDRWSLGRDQRKGRSLCGAVVAQYSRGRSLFEIHCGMIARHDSIGSKEFGRNSFGS